MKYKAGDTFFFGGAKCTVTGIDSFNGFQHYGVTYTKNDKFGAGWIPATLFDASEEPRDLTNSGGQDKLTSSQHNMFPKGRY